jgi:hypothetical protein
MKRFLILGFLSAASPAALAQGAPQEPPRPEEPFQELPILTWQEEFELNSTIRQVIFNAYLPMLARPTFYRGVHDDSIPNQVKDWDFQRPDVKEQLIARADVVDRQRRAHAALPDAEIQHLITKKKDFRQEDFERLITTSPRFEDLSVVVTRVQPLGNEVFRVDFSVKSKTNGVVEETKFDSVDLTRQGGTWLLPMKILLDVAPQARAQQAAASGQPLDPGQFVNNFIAVAEKTVKDIVPFDIPFLPK